MSRRFRNSLAIAAVASVAGVVAATVRSNRSAAAVTRYYTDSSVRAAIASPGALHADADRDKIVFVVVIFLAMAVWTVVLSVWTLRRSRLRLGTEGLWWIPTHGLRWRGPVAPRDVIALHPDARKRPVPLRIPFLGMGNRIAERLGLYDVTLLYLRSEDGLNLKHVQHLDLPKPPPLDARSYIPLPGVLLTTNPAFLKHLRAWIFSV